jgi:cold shock protein
LALFSIQPEDGGKDIYVHISAVEKAGLKALKDGSKLTFELITDKRTGRQSAGRMDHTIVLHRSICAHVSERFSFVMSNWAS